MILAIFGGVIVAVIVFAVVYDYRAKRRGWRVGPLAKHQFQDRLDVRAFDANPLSQDEDLDWMAWRHRNKGPDGK